MLKSGVKKARQSLEKWGDEAKLGLYGIFLATKNKRFWLVAGLVFVLFGTLLSLLSGGGASLQILKTSSVAEKTKIIWDAFWAFLGINRAFWDFLPIFITTVLQSTLFGLIVATWKWKKLQKKSQIKIEEGRNAKGLETAGIAAGLAILGSGCPTCGTTLLAPMIILATGSSGIALAGTISGILTVIAILLMLMMLKKIGFENYILTTSVKFQEKEQNDR